MERREFIKTSGVVAVSGITALAGCTGTSADAPPPRKSNVIEDVQLSEDGTALSINPVSEEEQWVQTRRDITSGTVRTEDTEADNTTTNTSANLSTLAELSPIGVASAAKGRGATGRGAGGYSSAPRTSNGRAWFFGGAYANTWYDNHEDEVDKVPVRVANLGIAYIGTNTEFEEQDPGPGPVSWDQTYDNSGMDTPIEANVADLQTGWYRVGADIVVDNRGNGDDEAKDLGWECIDVRIEETGSGREITERWKVSPRI